MTSSRPSPTHDDLKRLVATHGGVIAFARRAGVPAASLSRWLRSPPTNSPHYDRLLASPLPAQPRLNHDHSVDGDTLRLLRESRGLSIAEVASLVDEDPRTLTRWEETALTAGDFVRLHRRLRRLPEALYVSSKALTSLRLAHHVSLAEAALALGLPKTSLYRLEQQPPQLMSQHLLDVAASRFPLNAPIQHAGRRLLRFIHGAGLTIRTLEAVCGLSRKEARHLVALDAPVPLHAECLARLADHARLPPSTPLHVVDGSLLREARHAVGLTTAQTAAALGMSPWALKLAERNHGHLPMLLRIRALR